MFPQDCYRGRLSLEIVMTAPQHTAGIRPGDPLPLLGDHLSGFRSKKGRSVTNLGPDLTAFRHGRVKSEQSADWHFTLERPRPFAGWCAIRGHTSARMTIWSGRTSGGILFQRDGRAAKRRGGHFSRTSPPCGVYIPTLSDESISIKESRWPDERRVIGVPDHAVGNME